MSYEGNGSKVAKTFSTSSKKSGKASHVFGSNTNLTEIYLESDLELTIESESSQKSETTITATLNDFSYNTLNTPKASTVFTSRSKNLIPGINKKKNKDSYFAQYSEQAPKNKIFTYVPTPHYKKANVYSSNESKSSLNSILNKPNSLNNKNNTSYLSELEMAILNSKNPIEINETEEVEVMGERGILANKSEISVWNGVIPLSEYKINNDPNPIVIKKKVDKEINYVQELAIRYLRPPTPPAPGDIIIVAKSSVMPPPPPPLVIRQQPPRAPTPEPIVIRESPPEEPKIVGKKIITISGKHLPPPPRKVIIERLPPLPAKPQSILIERWLPYPKQKRRVIYQKENNSDLVVEKPKNVIIEWEAPKVKIKKEIKYLGVVRANPQDYVRKYSNLTKSNNLPEFVKQISTPNDIVLAADVKNSNKPQFELVGDLDALKLIDMDKEGLGEYKQSIKRLSSLERSLANSIRKSSESSASSIESVKSTKSIGDLIEKIFKTIDLNNEGVINLNNANKILIRLNSRMGKNYDENYAKDFLEKLDPNGDGTFDLENFKNAFYHLFKLI